MIELLTGFDDDVLAVKAHGRVTYDDYEKVLLPKARELMAKHAKIKVYYETTDDFAGYDVGAVWDDFAFGVSNMSRWAACAIVTDVAGLKNLAQSFHFLMPCPMKVFSTKQEADAKTWLNSVALESAHTH